MRKLLMLLLVAAFGMFLLTGCNNKSIQVDEIPAEDVDKALIVETEECGDTDTPDYEEATVPEWHDNVNYDSNPSMDEEQAKEYIAERESGGDYDAVSPSGKYIGRYQLDKDYLDGDYSPEHQEEVAEDYVMDRYGSWSAAAEHWRNYNWY